MANSAMVIPAWISDDKPFRYLGCYRQIEPLFAVGDQVRPCEKNSVRACEPNGRNRLEDGIYTVRAIETRGTWFDNYGCQIQLVEQPNVWYWAWDFIRADLTGWIAPASYLMYIYSCGFRRTGDHVFLPCVHCGAPNQWMPKAYYFGGFRCWRCHKWPRDHRRTRGLERKLVGQANFTFYVGERVQPRFPGKILSLAKYEDPLSGLRKIDGRRIWPGGRALVDEIWRPRFGPFEYMRLAEIPGVWDPRQFFAC